MKNIKHNSILSLLVILASVLPFCSILAGPATIFIPAAGNSWVVNTNPAGSKIIGRYGISNWTDTTTCIRTWFRSDRTGEITISIVGRVAAGNSEIKVSLGNQSHVIRIGNSATDTIKAGIFSTGKTGYQFMDLKGLSRTGPVFADVSGIVISGPATEGRIYFIKDDFYFGRRGPSVHLRYDLPAGTGSAEWFYNEVTVPEGNDVTGSYFMANGFSDGYFGIQVNSQEERRILFSVWSPYKTDKPDEIPEKYRIILLRKGPDVHSGEFGNEGSGGQSYRVFRWKSGTTYRFLLRGQPTVNNSTDYTAWFFAPETGKWELIASFRRPETNSSLTGLYSFLENFIPETGILTRKGYYSNQWIRTTDGKWIELTGAKFTADATARKESRLDYSGGVENNSFFLRNCGFFDDKTEMNVSFSRPGGNLHPEIDLKELEK